MPVVFNEPISFLQRLTEYMEYSYLLERADACATPEERLAVCIITHHHHILARRCRCTLVRLHVPARPCRVLAHHQGVHCVSIYSNKLPGHASIYSHRQYRHFLLFLLFPVRLLFLCYQLGSTFRACDCDLVRPVLILGTQNYIPIQEYYTDIVMLQCCYSKLIMH